MNYFKGYVSINSLNSFSSTGTITDGLGIGDYDIKIRDGITNIYNLSQNDIIDIKNGKNIKIREKKIEMLINNAITWSNNISSASVNCKVIIDTIQQVKEQLAIISLLINDKLREIYRYYKLDFNILEKINKKFIKDSVYGDYYNYSDLYNMVIRPRENDLLVLYPYIDFPNIDNDIYNLYSKCQAVVIPYNSMISQSMSLNINMIDPINKVREEYINEDYINSIFKYNKREYVEIPTDILFIRVDKENSTIYNIAVSSVIGENNFKFHYSASNSYLLNVSGKIEDLKVNPNIKESYPNPYKFSRTKNNDPFETEQQVVNLYNPFKVQTPGISRYANKELTDKMKLSETIDANKTSENYYHVYENMANSRNGNAVIYKEKPKAGSNSKEIIENFEKYHQYVYKFDIVNKNKVEIDNIIKSIPTNYKSCILQDENNNVIGVYLLYAISTGSGVAPYTTTSNNKLLFNQIHPKVPLTSEKLINYYNNDIYNVSIAEFEKVYNYKVKYDSKIYSQDKLREIAQGINQDKRKILCDTVGNIFAVYELK